MAWIAGERLVQEGLGQRASGSPFPARLLGWRDTPVGRVALGHGPPRDAPQGGNLYSVAWTENSYAVVDWGWPRASKIWGYNVGPGRRRAELRAGQRGEVDGTELSVVQPGGWRRDERRIWIKVTDGRQWFWQRRRVFELWRADDATPIYTEGMRWRNPWIRSPVGYRDDITEDEVAVAEVTQELAYFTSWWWWVQF